MAYTHPYHTHRINGYKLSSEKVVRVLDSSHVCLVSLSVHSELLTNGGSVSHSWHPMDLSSVGFNFKETRK